MSGDVSPPGGSWLDAPARPSGQPGRPLVASNAAGEPSLARVVWTTLRLWWRRRVLRVPDEARLGTLRWTAIAAVVALVAASCVALVAGTGHAVPPAAHVPVKPSAAQVETVANERAASQWVAAQVAPGTTVACDAVMCGYLISAGVSDDVVIGKGSAGISAALVVSTPVLRHQAGSRLAANSPEVVAAFGAGPTRVDVLAATTSTATFLAAAQHAVTASARLGRMLARNGRLYIGVTQRQELAAGQVDQRLLVMLQQMLATHSVHVASFGDADPGANWPAQLRSVTIDDLIHRARGRMVNQVTADLRVVHALQAASDVSTQQIAGPGGAPELVIQVPASP